MIKVCPTCGGNQVGCPTCDLPPKRANFEDKRPLSLVEGLEALSQQIQATWEVQGVDVSKWNGVMDFSITKTKCQYAFLRYGYGTQWKDSRVDTYYQDVVSLDFPVGAYWYCNVGVDYNLTAQSFSTLIAQKPPQLDIVLDIEATTLNPYDTLNWIKLVDAKLYNLTGKKPIIYTSPGFWNSKVARSNYWVGRTLWDAAWTTYPIPSIPLDWSNWTHWQWSADGNNRAKEYGMVKDGDYDMDLNRFNGTVSQFNSRYGTHIKPIGDNPPPPGLPEQVVVNSGTVNLRSAPDAYQDNVCGTTTYDKQLYPQSIELDPLGREWYKLGRKLYIAKWLTRLPSSQPPHSDSTPPSSAPDRVIVNTAGLNLRHAPDAYQDNVCGTTTYGKSLYPEGTELDSLGRKWYKLGKKVYTAEWLCRLP